MYRGELVNECIPIAGRPSCKVADGSWQPCDAVDEAALSAPSVPTTLSGETCILPAVSEMTTTVERVACGAVRLTHVSLSLSLPDCQVYRGEVVNECIPIAGRPSCKTANGSWQECLPGSPTAMDWMPATPPAAPNAPVAPAECIFPIT